MEQHRSGGRGDAPGGTRLCPEALGKYSPAGHSAHANRFAPGAAAGISSRSRKPHPARRVAPDISGEIPGDGTGAGADWTNRTFGRERLDHGRAWHRQRSCRANTHALSARATKPMVTVNAGGLSEGIFESELFGHVKGAFTDARADRVGRFELADGSTLFLDEIANVPLNLQAKLLRVLETGDLERVGSSTTRQVDVRIVSATNSDLNAEVVAGRFRADLQFRLNTIEIHLPPLRDRREDIPLLASHFLRPHAAHYRKHFTGFDEAAVETLL